MPGVRTIFSSWDVEKVHAVVARSRFWNEKVENTWISEHFSKLRCRKSVRRCGAKHFSKSKYTKHFSVGPLLEVEISKKCTPLWREAHFEGKMNKTPQCWIAFGGSSWCVLYILTSKCISRQNGGPELVHFNLEMNFAPQRRIIVHLSSGQMARTRRFSEPTFRPSGETNSWKIQRFAIFLTFRAPACSCF